MAAILDFLQGICQFVVSLVNFVLSTIEGLVEVVAILVVFLGQIPTYFLWLPDTILAMVVAIITTAVVYKILGRDG